jgi:hypothetical protein
MSLAIGLNLLPVFLNSLRQSFGTSPLTLEQLGRLGVLAFAGLCNEKLSSTLCYTMSLGLLQRTNVGTRN